MAQNGHGGARSKIFSSMSNGCPAGYGRPDNGYGGEDEESITLSLDKRKSTVQEGTNQLADVGGISYSKYLQLDKILEAQKLQSEIFGDKVHDEHLFIITHQAYELWFKQILYEIDSVRDIFIGRENLMKVFENLKMNEDEAKGNEEFVVDERRMLEIVTRISRCVKIMKILVDQVHILETMTPLNFMDFREHLSSASGFQSLQFRELENRLGIKPENRVKYNQENYHRVFEDIPNATEKLMASESEPSLSECIQFWLERTPGLEEDGFNFAAKFKKAVDGLLKNDLDKIESEANPELKKHLMSKYSVKRDSFDSIFEIEKHNMLVKRGERRFTHKALLGALMITLYKEEPRFHQPSLLLELLMDLEVALTKWRYNHVQLVQRMLGSMQVGTGGSSGYQYLRSTMSDRYKVFIDLFNSATFLIPRDRIPPLTEEMKTVLRTHSFSISYP